MFSNQETKGIFWYKIKKLEKNNLLFFQPKLTYDDQKFKKFNFQTNIVLIFYYQIGIFGPDIFVSIFEKLSFESF